MAKIQKSLKKIHSMHGIKKNIFLQSNLKAKI